MSFFSLAEGVSTGADSSSTVVATAAVVAVAVELAAVAVGVAVATGAATGDGVGVTVGCCCCELPEMSKSLALFCKETRRESAYRSEHSRRLDL